LTVPTRSRSAPLSASGEAGRAARTEVEASLQRICQEAKVPETQASRELLHLLPRAHAVMLRRLDGGWPWLVVGLARFESEVCVYGVNSFWRRKSSSDRRVRVFETFPVNNGWMAVTCQLCVEDWVGHQGSYRNLATNRTCNYEQIIGGHHCTHLNNTPQTTTGNT
jgi:hypothetical protein